MPLMTEPETDVLIIDDDQSIHVAVRTGLAGMVDRLFATSDPLEGIRLATQQHPDLILLDVMLPGENGYRVARTIREDEEAGVYDRRNKIILVTARDLSNDPEREELFGNFARPDRVVYKPFELEDLLRQIEELLSE